jgi:hypothetical protein
MFTFFNMEIILANTHIQLIYTYINTVLLDLGISLCFLLDCSIIS